MTAVCVQQHGDGHAHILGASCNHDILPKCGNTCKTRIQIVSFYIVCLEFNLYRKRLVTPVTCAFNNFPDSPGSGGKHGGLIEAHAAHIDHVEAVHVLGWGHCITDCALINVFCGKSRIN